MLLLLYRYKESEYTYEEKSYILVKSSTGTFLYGGNIEYDDMSEITLENATLLGLDISEKYPEGIIVIEPDVLNDLIEYLEAQQQIQYSEDLQEELEYLKSLYVIKSVSS